MADPGLRQSLIRPPCSLYLGVTCNNLFIQVIGGLLGAFAMEEEESHSRTAEGREAKGTPSPSVKPKEGWGAA